MGIQFLKVSSMSKPSQTAAPPPAAQQDATHAAGVAGGRPLQGCGQGTPGAMPGARTIAKRVGIRAKRVYVMHGRPLLSRVYRFFGLRHGTMMIAIHDLLWSSFVVFLLVLATAHTREVARKVESDVQAHMAERAQADSDLHQHHQHKDLHHGAGCGGQPTQPSQPDTRSFYERYIEAALSEAEAQFTKEMQENEIKLNNGLHIATAMTVVMVFGISMAGIDMIASMMLLAGAMLHVRQLMMPWLSLRLLEMMLLVGGSMVAMFCYAHSIVFFKIFFGSLLIICVVFYHWLVAYSLHEQLCRLERTGLVHHTRPGHHHHHHHHNPNTLATLTVTSGAGLQAGHPGAHHGGHQMPVHTCCPNSRGRLYHNHLFGANGVAKTYLVPVMDCHHVCGAEAAGAGDTADLLSAADGQPMSAPPVTLVPAAPAAPAPLVAPMPLMEVTDLPANPAPPTMMPSAPAADGASASDNDDEKDQFPV